MPSQTPSKSSQKDLLTVGTTSTDRDNLDDSTPLGSPSLAQSSASPAAPPPREVFTLRDQLIGFPFWQMAVVMIVRFSEPVAFTSLFPYIYFMVKHLRPDGSVASIATYAGYISGMFALCQALTGVHWGRYSDKYGRKPILLIGLMGSAVSLFWFGCSTSYSMAMIARCFGGFLNGNVGVIRTAIGEIAPRRRHQALAMSTMSLLWQSGCVVGPMLGGSLADPIKNHPNWFSSDKDGFWKILFTKRPFLLPNIATSLLLISGTIFAFLFLEESHEDFKSRNSRDPGLFLGDALIKLFTRGKVDKAAERRLSSKSYSDSESETDIASGSEDADESTTLIQRVDSIIEDDLEYVSGQFTNPNNHTHNPHHHHHSTNTNTPTDYGSTVNTQPAEASTPVKKYDDNSKGSFFDALTVPVLGTITMYALIALQTIVFDELLPVMLSTPIETSPEFGGPSRPPFHFVGGLSLTSIQVGHLLSSTGLLGTGLVMFFFPYIDGKYGTYNPLSLVMKVFPITSFAVPFVLFLIRPGDAEKTNGFTLAMWVTLLIMSVRTMLMAIAFPGVMILIQRAITNRKHTGGINGLSQMFAAGARAIGPIVWGLIMAKGQELHLAQLPWWTLTLFSMSGFILVAFLDRYKHILASEADFK